MILKLKFIFLKYRPVNVYISGEVKKTGLYKKIDYSGGNSVNANEIYYDTAPKLYDSIQIAKGVTSIADLSKIQIIRHNSKTQGGGKLKQTLICLH